MRRPARRARLGAGLLLALALPRFAAAVVHTSGDGSGNTQATPPADDPGIANVGSAEGLTAVYLGGGWVISADHVGEKALTLLGASYPALPGSHRQLDHDPTRQADLAVYRIQGAPPLPALTLAASPPAVGEEVVAVGNGYNREPGLTAWDADWTPVAPPGSFRGYRRASGSAIRWGRNEIDAVGLEFDVGTRLTRGFLLSFDEAGLPDEMQTVTKDSGGGVFVKRGGTWELVGILFLQIVPEALAGQPGDTAVFGDASVVVDLHFYRAQVEALTNPRIPASPAPARLALGLLLAGVAGVALRRRRPACAPPR